MRAREKANMPGCGEIGEEGERRLERCRTPSYWIMVIEFELDPKSNGKHWKLLNRTEVYSDLYFGNSTVVAVWGMHWRQGETEAWCDSGAR